MQTSAPHCDASAQQLTPVRVDVPEGRGRFWRTRHMDPTDEGKVSPMECEAVPPDGSRSV